MSTISDDKLMDIIKLVKETYNKFLKVVLYHIKSTNNSMNIILVRIR